MVFLITFHPAAKKQNTEYFIQLVRIALADEHVNTGELAQLYRIGEKLGFSKKEIKKLISNVTQTDYIPPNQLAKRFEQVYEIVKLMLADGIINHTEMSLAKSFASTSGFHADDIPGLFVLLINGIRHDKTAAELFDEFKNQKKY
jgi:hypothetical protein